MHLTMHSGPLEIYCETKKEARQNHLEVENHKVLSRNEYHEQNYINFDKEFIN